MRECLHPVRLQVDQTCETPQMAQSFCNAESCLDDETAVSALKDRKLQQQTIRSIPERAAPTDACSLIAHALLVDFEIFDVVFLPLDSCRAPIAKGDFAEADLHNVLPNNEELIALRVPGSILLQALQDAHTIMMERNHNANAVEPKLAGMRYKVDPSSSNHIVDAEILSRSCQWKPVVADELYYVLTTRPLAEGAYGYHVTPCSDLKHCATAAFSGLRLADEFWTHLSHVCILRDPNRRPIQSHQPMRPKVIRTQENQLSTAELAARSYQGNKTTTASM